VPQKSVKMRALAPEVVLPREEQVLDQSESVNQSKGVDKSESVDKRSEPLSSNPVSPPARPDAVRQDQSFSGVPGLGPRHTDYMKFVPLPGTIQWKQRRNPLF